MQMAAAKSNPVEQKFLLLESLEFLKNASKDEEKLGKMILDNSVSVKSSRQFNEYTGK
jgi:hypothetical protein